MEHRVVERDYEEILQDFIVVGERIERAPDAYSSQNEEDLRFYFINGDKASVWRNCRDI